MDFLKKAKQTMKELEGDLNKATAQLGFGEKSHHEAQSPMAAAPAAAAPASSSSTPTTSNVNTPATSVAPSTAGDAPKTKLPLAIRKEGMHIAQLDNGRDGRLLLAQTSS